MKPGFKQTEVGEIPEDWDVAPLTELGEFKNGINKSSESFGHGSPFVNLMDVFGVSRICPNKELGLVETNAEEQRIYNLQKGDVLFIRSSVKPSGVGLTAVIEDFFPNAVYSGFLLRFRDNGKLANGFKAYCFHESGFRKRVIGASSVSANTNINQDSLKRLHLAFPPTLAEQEAIAGALGDADALIESLERLVAKKRDVKQGAMQELLTARRRLPGFKGEWEVTRFEKVVRHHAGNSTLIKGKLPSSEAVGLFPAYSASGQDVWCDHFEHEGDAIVISAVGSRCGKAFAASGKWCAIANTHVVWPNLAKIDSRFLGYIINDEDFWQKSGTGQPFVLFAKTFARPLRLPALSEQTAIAAVLSDMDAELAALEAKLAKARAIKQGMMQELLTGRIRLK